MTTDMDLGAAYLGLFGRTADAPGFAYWKESLDAGNIDLATLIKHFTNTREFADRTEFAESDAAFIAEAYTLILGRTADAAGQSWLFRDLCGWTGFRSCAAPTRCCGVG